MATAKGPSQLERLAAEFPAGAHKTRSQGGTKLTYLSIDSVINRLNDVLGADWSTDAETSIEVTEKGYLATCQLRLRAVVDGTSKQAYGIGCDLDQRDADKAAKTALAEAIKKASHQLGVGLYLWDPEARASVERKQRLEGASTAALKQEVFKLAKGRLPQDNPTAKDIAALFGVPAGSLSDDATLRGILEKEGLL